MYKNYKVVALICCRGGSKGIPNKNIKKLQGKPLLGWILEAAKEAEVFDEIILSTDSLEISNVGQKYGASIPGLRPSHLAQDDSDQFETHHYIFQQLKFKDEAHRICILANNPFIDANLIRQGYEKAVTVNFNQVVLDSVPIGGDYIYYRQCYEHNGTLWFHFPKVMLESQINRQTVAPTFTTINNMRWGKPSVFDSYEAYKNEIVLNGIVPVWLPKIRNFDLDDQEDWEIAEAVFSMLQKIK